jgi:fimbrial chaperone protein
MMRNIGFCAVLGACLALLFPGHALALGMSPMSLELSSAGGGSRSQFTINNNSNAPAAVEITVETLSYSEDGKAVRKLADDDLMISPPVAMIQPGASQVFRVQWVGDPDLATSRSFMVMASQLPLRDKSGKPVVQVTQAFGAIVNVAPLNGRSTLNLVSASPAKTIQGGPAVSILVENPTDVHALICRTVLYVGSTVVHPTAMRTRVGVGVVGPHSRRRFIVPLDSTTDAKSVSLEYRNEQ